jgi:hypothetical protein
MESKACVFYLWQSPHQLQPVQAWGLPCPRCTTLGQTPLLHHGTCRHDCTQLNASEWMVLYLSDCASDWRQGHTLRHLGSCASQITREWIHALCSERPLCFYEAAKETFWALQLRFPHAKGCQQAPDGYTGCAQQPDCCCHRSKSGVPAQSLHVCYP